MPSGWPRSSNSFGANSRQAPVSHGTPRHGTLVGLQFRFLSLIDGVDGVSAPITGVLGTPM